MDMQFIFSGAGAVCVGYVIPVLLSFLFIMISARLTPRLVSRDGRIKPTFLILDGIVWVLGAAISGYVTGIVMPDLPWAALLVTGTFLIGLIWSNRAEMKKIQSVWRLVALSVGTVLGLGGGLQLFWLTYPVS